MDSEKINQLAEDFLSRLSLPLQKSKNPLMIAAIGLVGSGRTTAAEKFTELIDGLVLVQSNSARYLLKEMGLPWGQNVRDILKQVSKSLLSGGYGVVFDGNAADEEDRQGITETAQEFGARIFYVRILIAPEIAKQREKQKYDDPGWASSFENFRVGTTEKMLKNIDDRAELHRTLKSDDISGLIGEIDNNDSIEALNRQVEQIAEKIKTAL